MRGNWGKIAIVAMSAWIALATSAANAQQNGKIVYLGIGGATQEALRKAYFEPFAKETGIQVVEDTGLSAERVQAEVQSGHPTIDVTNISTAAYETLLAKDLLAPIDYKYYEPADLKSMPEGTMRGKFSVSTSYTSLGMSFSTAAFPEGKPQPNSWADFWDVRHSRASAPCRSAACSRATGRFPRRPCSRTACPPTSFIRSISRARSRSSSSYRPT